MPIHAVRGIVLLLLVPGAFCLENWARATDRSDSQEEADISKIEVTVFEDGASQPVRQQAVVALIKQQAEAMFRNSDNALYELVTNQTIQKIKSNEMAVEIVYRKPVVVGIKNPALAVEQKEIDRLFIPLCGDYPRGTVFFGLGTYTSGPVLYHGGTDKIREVLVAHGVSAKR